MVTPAAKREAVAHLVGAYEMSERRACRLIKTDRKTFAIAPIGRQTRISDAA